MSKNISVVGKCVAGKMTDSQKDHQAPTNYLEKFHMHIKHKIFHLILHYLHSIGWI